MDKDLSGLLYRALYRWSVASIVYVAAIGVAIAGDTSIMPRVDERVRKAVAAGDTVSVIVVCSDDCAAVGKALREMSISVDESAIEMGSLSTAVDATKLKKIEVLDGIDFIELDEDVSTF